MAITNWLPLERWYYDTTSEWTLDYPPLFAYLEYVLGRIAISINLKDAVHLTKELIRTQQVIIYQKLTVIATDFIYYYAIYRLCLAIETYLFKTKQEKSAAMSSQNPVAALLKPHVTSSIALVLLLQPCLILVDHIHFQYNGFLSGVLILSISHIICENYGWASFWFATLIHLKHIYLYCAPAFGMYLLCSYCLGAAPNNGNRLLSFLKRMMKLGIIVITVSAISFAPFATPENLKQIASRLFPFKRGLTHAYWAPNIWALYNLVDKISTIVIRARQKARFDMDSISRVKLPSSTSGLVQEYKHESLPTIDPIITFALVALFNIPLIIKFLLNTGRTSSKLFLKGLTIASFTSFMFGWHVHEKAIILVLLPLIMVSFLDPNLFRVFTRMTLVGTYSVLPLMFKPAEYPTKICVLVAYHNFAKSLKPRIQPDNNNQNKASSSKGFIRTTATRLYNLFDILLYSTIVLNEIYITLIHQRLGRHFDWNILHRLDKFEFLPLLTTSCISSLGISFSYFELYYDFVFGGSALDEVPAFG